MEWSLLLFALIVIIVFLLKYTIEKTTAFPYEQQPYLFSPAERSFLGVLNQAVNQDTIVMGKVRVADVIRPRKGLTKQAWGRAFHRVTGKHFDFLLCDSKDLSVKAVIELDDSSHSQKKRKNRDEFVEKACSAAGLTLHRFKVSAGYSIPEIRNVLYPEIASNPEIIGTEQRITESIPISQIANEEMKTEGQVENNAEKVCPKCSSDLVVKIAKQGKYKGDRFLACSAFPKCRFISKIEG